MRCGGDGFPIKSRSISDRVQVNFRSRKIDGHTCGTDVLIQAEAPKGSVAWHGEQLGFEITDEAPEMISLHGPKINLFIERRPALGPVFEVFVGDVKAAKARLVKSGCQIVKDEPDFPRSYVRDPSGLIYNLSKMSVLTVEDGVTHR